MPGKEAVAVAVDGWPACRATVVRLSLSLPKCYDDIALGLVYICLLDTSVWDSSQRQHSGQGGFSFSLATMLRQPLKALQGSFVVRIKGRAREGGAGG